MAGEREHAHLPQRPEGAIAVRKLGRETVPTGTVLRPPTCCPPHGTVRAAPAPPPPAGPWPRDPAHLGAPRGFPGRQPLNEHRYQRPPAPAPRPVPLPRGGISNRPASPGGSFRVASQHQALCPASLGSPGARREATPAPLPGSRLPLQKGPIPRIPVKTFEKEIHFWGGKILFYF